MAWHLSIVVNDLRTDRGPLMTAVWSKSIKTLVWPCLLRVLAVPGAFAGIEAPYNTVGFLYSAGRVRLLGGGILSEAFPTGEA